MPVSTSRGRVGVIEAGTRWGDPRLSRKASRRPTMPGAPQQVYASMGNYLFSAGPCSVKSMLTRSGTTVPMTFGAIYCRALLGGVPMYAYDFQAHRVRRTG